MDISEIVRKRFSRSLIGYDIREVDLFLDEIIGELERLQGERTELMRAMDSLLEELEQFDEIRATAERERFHVPERQEQDAVATADEAADDAPAVTGGRTADTPAETAVSATDEPRQEQAQEMPETDTDTGGDALPSDASL